MDKHAIDSLNDLHADETSTPGDRDIAATSVLEHARSRGWRRLAWFNSCALWLAVAVLIVLHTCACAVQTPPAQRGRTVAEQDRAVLRVDRLCMGGDPFTGAGTAGGASGSAVYLSGNRAVTAAHVITCGKFESVLIFIEDVDGKRYPARVATLDAGHDLAVITFEHALSVPPVVIGRAHVGDRVCGARALPLRTRDCGVIDVINMQSVPSSDGDATWLDIYDSLHTIHGNSGSGSYNEAGELIGITTNMRYNTTNDGGIESSLFDKGIAL